MGYRKVPTIYVLEFDKHDGLVVRMKGMKIGKLRRLIRVMDEDEDSRTGEMVEEVVDLFAGHLASWNLEPEEGGDTLPTTREEVEELELNFLFDLVNGWMQAMTGVEDDLGKDSPSGEQFPGQPVMMEAL